MVAIREPAERGSQKNFRKSGWLERDIAICGMALDPIALSRVRTVGVLVLCPENSFDKSCALTCATSMHLHLLHLSVIYGTTH